MGLSRFIPNAGTDAALSSDAGPSLSAKLASELSTAPISSTLTRGSHGFRKAVSFFHEPVGVQVISCNALGADVRWDGRLARVMCPAHCEKEPATLAMGSGVHPFRSSVCLSAIVDKVMPVYGGELLLSKSPVIAGESRLGGAGLQAYTGANTEVASSIAVTGEKGEAWQGYAIDNVDSGRAWPPEKVLNCGSTFDSLGLKNVGDSVIAKCPGRCAGVGKLAGTLIHTPDSSVCRAADFGRIVGDEGGRVVVTMRHGQEEYFSGRTATDASSDAGGTRRSYTVALPTSDVLARMASKPEHASFL
eukprot:TRINITY_DN5113_c1_g5_i1.p1 TRINITY_DN5113_c1_g5~~TRINITY_DN5113_c1_g5_i1.p1  ORF type:complete len:304 (-),score=39.11 TRINITY_DN5113_c1_g5_i1:197-1108(-)